MKEEWLLRGAVVPVDVETTAALVAEIKRLIDVVGDMALAQPEQTNTRPYYTINELNAWADEKEKQTWRNAAIRIGEELSSVGPDGYYDMDAWKWLEWAIEQEPRGKNSLAQPYIAVSNDRMSVDPHTGNVGIGTVAQRTWVGLTDEEIQAIAKQARSKDHAVTLTNKFLKEKQT